VHTLLLTLLLLLSQLHGVSEAASVQQAAKPLVLLNDKRHGPGGKPDRRLILDVDALAANLSALYPGCEVSGRRVARTGLVVTSAYDQVYVGTGDFALFAGRNELCIGATASDQSVWCGTPTSSSSEPLLDICASCSGVAPLLLQVRAVRLRDLSWPDKLRLLSRTSVFVTTQGSSAFRLVFLPRGSTAVIVGGPETGSPEWVNFHELDRWFPLSYVQFSRYEIHTQNTWEYEVQVVPGWWQPDNRRARRAWWLYNAHVRMDIQRLRGLLDGILLRRRQ
jgi:hypothetical protein